jgi:hypothetical protein
LSQVGTLAALLNRLLDDIIAPQVDTYTFERPPPGLLRLIQSTPQDTSTTYTREQLEIARDDA